MEKIELSEYTIGEMVSEDYRKAEVFKSFGLDFCCGGKKTIDVACSEKDIDVNALTQALLALDTDKAVHTRTTRNAYIYAIWEVQWK